MFDPYAEWLGLSSHLRPPTPFQLLDLTPGSFDEIDVKAAAETQLRRVRAHQQGPQGFLVLKLVGEILEARDALLDPMLRSQFAPQAVPQPSEEKAWYADSLAEPKTSPAESLQIAGPDLTETNPSPWWAGEKAPGGEPLEERRSAWWTDPEAQEVEPLEIPQAPIVPEPKPEEVVAEIKQRSTVVAEPFTDEIPTGNTRQILIIGGLLAALIGVGVVIFLLKRDNPAPDKELVQNPPPKLTPPVEKAKEKEKEKETPPTKEPEKSPAIKEPLIAFDKPNLFRFHAGIVNSVAVRPDGREIFSVGSDKLLYSRDLAASKPQRRFQFGEGGIQVVYGSDANLLVACDSAQVVVLDPGATTPRRKIATPRGGFRCLALYSDGIHLLTGSSDGYLRLWNIPDDKLVFAADVTPNAEIVSLGLAPDQSQVMVGSSDGRVMIYDLKKQMVSRSSVAHTRRVLSVAISPDGLKGASIGEDKTVQLWDMVKGVIVRRIEPQIEVITGVAWSSDSRRVLTCGLEREVKMFDASNSKMVWSAPVQERSFALAIDPKDRYVVLVGDSGTIELIPLPRIRVEDTAKEILVKPPAERLQLMPEEMLTPFRQQVRQRYAEDFERRQPVEVAALLEKLLRQAVIVQHEIGYRQALFAEAFDLASRNVMIEEIYKILDGQTMWFLFDDLAIRAQALQTLSATAPNPMQKQFAELALNLLPRIQQANRLDLVDRVMKVAEDSAKFSGVKELIDRASKTKKLMEGLALSKARLIQATKKLESMPDDPEANQILGRQRTLIEGAWGTGLPMLAKSNDERWKMLAKLDLSEPKDAPTQFRLGNDWFSLAMTVAEDEKVHAFNRSKLWLEKALESGLTGTDKLDATSKVRKIKEMK